MRREIERMEDGCGMIRGGKKDRLEGSVSNAELKRHSWNVKKYYNTYT